MMNELLSALDPALCEAVRICFSLIAPVLGIRIAFRLVCQGYGYSVDFWDLCDSFFSLFKKKPKAENTNDSDLNSNLAPQKVNLSKLANEPLGFMADEYYS